jgi:hypothetical protein
MNDFAGTDIAPDDWVGSFSPVPALPVDGPVRPECVAKLGRL